MVSMRVMKKLRTIRYIVRRINNTNIKHYNISKLKSKTRTYYHHSHIGFDVDIRVVSCYCVNRNYYYYWEEVKRYIWQGT